MKTEDLKNLNDNELLMLYREDDENAKNLLYMKYKFIIDLLIKKYNRVFLALNIDVQEIYSECTVGFSDGIISYDDNKDTTLTTYITLCIERRIKSILRKYNNDKYKVVFDTFSLDFSYDNGLNLMEIISDNCLNDPLKNITDNEEYKELVLKIKKLLTKNEWDVFILMANNLNYHEIAKIQNKNPKQIDNAMQRVKIKVKKILKEISD